MSAGIDAKVLSSSPAGAILTGDVIIPQTNRLRLPSESDYTEEDTFGSNDNDQTIFKKMFLKSQAIGLESYKMNLKQRGYAIIVNNENFHPITSVFFFLNFVTCLWYHCHFNNGYIIFL